MKIEKLSERTLHSKCKDIAKNEFRHHREDFPYGYDTEDLMQDILYKFHKSSETLDDLQRKADTAGYPAVAFLHQKLLTYCRNIHRHYLAIRRELSMLAAELEYADELTDIISQDADFNEQGEAEQIDHAKLIPSQATGPDKEVSHADDMEAFKSSLSDIDKDIVDLYLSGYTEREIAEKTGLSKTSVHKHIAAILKNTIKEQ
jgi:DNA-directed RNA polymerase specialized sigma24 family protein